LNVLESISIVSKVGVSCYKFNGTANLGSTLETMKQDAYQEACLHEGICSLQKTPQNNPILKCLDRFKQPASSSAGSSSEGKKNCSLTMLSKLLIMCFLVTEVTEMTQDQLMNIILKDSTEKSKYCNNRHIDILSAKTRRLNDIVNILSALHLLEKKNEKSVNSFKWLGDKIMQSTSSNTAFTTVINHNLSNKILASSLFPSITSNPNIFSPSKMPLKKRKRVKISGNGSPTGDETSPLSADSSNSPFSSQLPDTQHLPPISTTSNSPLFHTCATPTSSSSTGGLHFQFRSPPSKKNKPTPASEKDNNPISTNPIIEWFFSFYLSFLGYQLYKSISICYNFGYIPIW